MSDIEGVQPLEMDTSLVQYTGIADLDTSLAQEEEQEDSGFDENAPPQCSGMKGTILWCGGGNTTSTKLRCPKSTFSY